MYKLNQIIFTKKEHVCGSNKWKIIRVGVDIKIECMGCGRVVMVPSFELNKWIKPILSKKELQFLEEYEANNIDKDVEDK